MKKSNTFLKWLVTVVCAVIALTPTWIFFAVKSALEPNGFWQNFVIYGVGIYFLGGLQLAFLIILIVVLLSMVWDY